MVPSSSVRRRVRAKPGVNVEVAESWCERDLARISEVASTEEEDFS